MTVYQIQIGASYTAGDLQYLISPYTDGGFEPSGYITPVTVGEYTHLSNTFTNSSGANRTVREITIIIDNNNYTGYRKVLDINDMQNFCIVPNGATVTIDYYWNVNSPSTRYVSATMDTSTFTSSAAIHYNAVPLKNGLLSKINPAYGALGWDVECFTLDYADITAINAFAGPISTGTSITGKQYVVSAFRAGTLKIKNPITNAYVSYNNCYILAPIDVTPFGDGYNYTVKVIQSAYDEA